MGSDFWQWVLAVLLNWRFWVLLLVCSLLFGFWSEVARQWVNGWGNKRLDDELGRRGRTGSDNELVDRILDRYYRGNDWRSK